MLKRVFDIVVALMGLILFSPLMLIEGEALSNPEMLDDEYMNVILPPKLAMDRQYIEQQSLGLDLKILLRTAWVLLADRLRAQS